MKVLLILISALFLMVGCGRKGNLQLPETHSQTQEKTTTDDLQE